MKTIWSMVKAYGRRLEFSFWLLFFNAENRRALAAMMRAALAQQEAGGKGA